MFHLMQHLIRNFEGGRCIKDFMSPDRVVVGIESSRTEEVHVEAYQPFLLQNFRVIFMDILSVEMTKYAANAMLATAFHL